MGCLSALPPFVYVGRVNCVTGYGQAARLQVHALRKHGMRLQIADAGSTADPDPERASPFVQACLRDDDLRGASPVGSIIHLSPNCAIEWLDRVPRPHILVSVWETTRLPRAWVSMVNAFDQVWCPTEWQRQVYLDSGVREDLLRVVPFALDPELYPVEGPVLPQLAALRAEGYTVFGSMFQWSERKAPRHLIGAYLQAFQHGEKVALVIKTYEGDNPTDVSARERVEELCSRYMLSGPRPRIEVISQRLSYDETLAFYRGVTFVSLHRGEGFGLGIAESLLLERNVIATDWSAPAEWARPHGSALYWPVPYTLESPYDMQWQQFYSIDQQWASPDISYAAEAMAAAYRLGLDAISLPPSRALLGSLVDQVGPAAAKAIEELFS